MTAKRKTKQQFRMVRVPKRVTDKVDSLARKACRSRESYIVLTLEEAVSRGGIIGTLGVPK